MNINRIIQKILKTRFFNLGFEKKNGSFDKERVAKLFGRVSSNIQVVTTPISCIKHKSTLCMINETCKSLDGSGRTMAFSGKFTIA